MHENVLRLAVIAIFTLGGASAALAQLMTGTTGSESGAGWQASWLDLKQEISFKKGETLRFKVEGKAENVLIRLLPASSQPSSSDGIEGGVRKVPPTKSLDVRLDRDHPNIRQISAHAGTEAWGRPLGPNNGSVVLLSVERIK